MASGVALITGAAKRLGRAIALGLAAHGYDLLLHYHQSETEAQHTAARIRQWGRQVELVKADLTQVSEIQALVNQGYRRFGQIDALICNAAIFQRQEIAEITTASWDAMLNVNLRAAFFCAQQVLPLMQRQGHGRIINLASVGGLLPYRHHLAYSVSKAGLMMLTKCLALEGAPQVLVNAIAPGSIEFSEETSVSPTMPRTRIPSGQFTQPTEVVQTVLYLLEPTHQMTGQILTLDGGRTLV
ncbi:SDR family oxidoreductase [candidate division KSB1 bacterium]|nr:SDR family oxidoreductase [candidate division KSB1 bacterium]